MKTRKLSAAANPADSKPSAEAPKGPRESDSSRRAKRNADAYTGFVVMSALSTALFLTGTGLTVHSALRYGKSAGKEALLKTAGNSADELFSRSGELSEDAKTYSEGVPGLYGMLKSIERRAESENDDIQSSIREMRVEAKADRQADQRRLRDTAIVAGCGVIGMIIFISAAKIARHRGNMLFGRDSRKRVRAEVAPRLSSQELGATLTLRF